MLSIKKIIAIVNLLFTTVVLGQQYVTYTENEIPNHSIMIKDSILEVNTFDKNMLSEIKIGFLTEFKSDTLITHEKIQSKKSNGIRLFSDFLESFYNAKFIKTGNDKIILIDDNRPYFSKKTIDSIIGDNYIFYVNGILHKSPLDKALDLKRFLKKPKKSNVKKLTGKQAYKKYGLIGIYGVFEIDDKKKYCKKTGNTI